MPKRITIRAGDTEPLEFTVSGKIDGADLANLDNLSSAALYMVNAAGTTEVDGASCTVESGLTLSFNPASNGPSGADAFATAGDYKGYLVLTWTDGDETRHPSDEWLWVSVSESIE